MRKTQRCTEVKLERAPMRMRKCLQPRGHTGHHLDMHGTWQSTQAQSTDYDPAVEDTK